MQNKKPESKTVRMLRILSLLNRWEGKTAKKIADQLGVDERTVYRYIKELNEIMEMDSTEIIDRNEDGYILKDTHFLDNLQGLNDYNVIAALSNSTFGDALNYKPLIDKKMIAKMSMRVEPGQKIESDILKTLFTALSGNHRVIITYISSKHGESTYDSIPLRILARDGEYYLQLYSFNYKKIIQFRISKINDIALCEVCRDTELINEKLDYLHSRWGFMANDTDGYAATITFTVDNSLDNSLYLSPLHTSQTREVRDGKSYYTLKVHNLREFILWAMKFSYHLTVISPQWAIDEFRKQAFDILKRYP